MNSVGVPEKQRKIVALEHWRQNMEYEDFLKKVKELTYVTTSHIEDYSYYNKKTKSKGEDQISVSWTTGGVTGGSCWDTGDEPDRHRPVRGEQEPEFEALDLILGHFCPAIGFLQYKNLCAGIIKTDSQTQNDYYGNYTEVGIKFCVIKDLYTELCARELI
jgi:hypothetical protein